LVEFIVGGVAGRIAEGGAVLEAVVQRGGERDDIGVGGTAFGVAEKGARVGGERFAVVGRHAAVGDSLIVEVFKTDAQHSALPEAEAGGRVEAFALELNVFAIASGILVNAGEAQCRVTGDGLVDIERGAILLPRSGEGGEFVKGSAARAGLFGRAIQNSAWSAAAEHHAGGALQDFEPVDVVEVAVVLDVVAHAIDKVVPGGAVPAQHDGIAVAFALGDADARQVAGSFADAGDGGVGEKILGEDGDGLRGVKNRSGGLGRDGGFLDIVTVGAGGVDLDRVKHKGGVGAHL